MIDPLDRIIWSADVDGMGALLNALADLPDLRYIKLDRLFLTDCATQDAIEMIEARGFRVFVDAKIVEIPSKVEAIARKYVKHNPWMLNCMAGCISNGNLGPDARVGNEEADGLRRFANICHENDVRPCAVTVLTSKTEEIAEAEFGPGTITQVLWYTEMLVRAGFTDVVCSPQEAAAIKRNFGDVITINCPGIRLPNAVADDQARIATPSGAVAAGADRLVIGRPITNGQLSKVVDDLSSPLHGEGP